MDRAAHRAWLAELAERDGRLRAQAEPERRREEARLQSARTTLAASQTCEAVIEAALGEARQESDDPPLGAS